MAQLDLDDLPPRVAALLTSLPAGDEVVLVQHGAVVARLTVSSPPDDAATDPEVEPEQKMREVFENFRAAVEDEF